MRKAFGVSLLDLQQLHIEGERGVGRDDARMTAAPVRIVRAAHELRPLTYRQSGDSLVPAANHFALANGELERFASGSRRVEHRAVFKRAGVVDDGDLSIFGECASYGDRKSENM